MTTPRQRKLAFRAFLTLWGGWSALVFLLTLVLPRFLFDADQTALGLVVIVLAGAGMALWEWRFRRKHLPPLAGRLWHAWLVAFPLLTAGLLPKYAHVLCRYVPGGLRESATFLYWTPPAADGSRAILFPVDVEMTNPGWNPHKLPRHAVIKSRPAWQIDCVEGTAAAEGTLLDLNAEGFATLARRAAPNLTPAEQTELSGILADHLHKGFFPIPGSTRIEITVLKVTTGTAPVPWVQATALLFSLLLLPVTWFVVRFTMFPKGVPLRD